jgi:biotin transporter BioY
MNGHIPQFLCGLLSLPFSEKLRWQNYHGKEKKIIIITNLPLIKISMMFFLGFLNLSTFLPCSRTALYINVRIFFCFSTLKKPLLTSHSVSLIS